LSSFFRLNRSSFLVLGLGSKYKQGYLYLVERGLLNDTCEKPVWMRAGTDGLV
jgi:hypothetical protein